MTQIIEFIETHFWHAAPILLAGIFVAGITFERVFALYKLYPMAGQDGFFNRVRDHLFAGDVTSAISLCDQYSAKPVARIVKKGLLRAHQPIALVENGLDIAIEEEVQRIQKRTSFLSMLANVATLLGLLGTIAGLIMSFGSIETADAQARAAALARGISQALNATMMGLFVAIPAMVFFSFLMNKTQILLSDVEMAATKVIDLLRQRYFVAEKDLLPPGSDGKKNRMENVA